jgi:hypothetical protein
MAFQNGITIVINEQCSITDHSFKLEITLPLPLVFREIYRIKRLCPEQ